MSQRTGETEKYCQLTESPRWATQFRERRRSCSGQRSRLVIGGIGDIEAGDPLGDDHSPPFILPAQFPLAVVDKLRLSSHSQDSREPFLSPPDRYIERCYPCRSRHG